MHCADPRHFGEHRGLLALSGSLLISGGLLFGYIPLRVHLTQSVRRRCTRESNGCSLAAVQGAWHGGSHRRRSGNDRDTPMLQLLHTAGKMRMGVVWTFRKLPIPTQSLSLPKSSYAKLDQTRCTNGRNWPLTSICLVPSFDWVLSHCKGLRGRSL